MEENINEEDVRKFYELLEHKKQTEIRVIELSDDFKTSKIKGHYFVSSEEEFVNKVKELNGKYNLYAGLNERKDKGTIAKDVISVKSFFIDIDCKIKPASEEDLIECRKVVDDIIKDIFEKTNQKPTIIFSGNGYQLVYCIPLIEINDNNREDIGVKILSFSRDLVKRFSNDKIKLDNVGDLPRIIRITGTTNVKGGKLSKFVEINKEENKLLEDYILSFEEKNEVDLDKLIPLNLSESQLDRFFKTFLEEEFPEGAINDTIEKNFAIYLRGKNIPLEGIEEIYHKHNWNFERLKGWIKKVDEGEIDELNVGEIILWIRKYCPDREEELLEPLIKEDTPDLEKDYSLKLIEENSEYDIIKQFLGDFDKYAYRQPFTAVLSFHHILGQLIKEVSFYKKEKFPIDQRINLFVVRPSGTGKSIGLDFTSKVSEELGLRVRNLTDFTDAGLIGSIEKPTEGSDGITYGIFYDSDCIIFDEGETLFENNPHKQGAVRRFNVALNPLNQPSQRITKIMRWDTLSYFPHFSTNFVSVPFREFEKIIKSGFFQRHLVYIEDEAIEERFNCLNEDISRVSFKTSKKIRENIKNVEEENLSHWKKKFEDLKYFASEGEFEEDEGVIEYIREKIDGLFKTTAKIKVTDVMSIMFSFLSRYTDQLYRLCFQSAVIRHSKKVQKIDVDYAFSIIKKTYLSILYYIEINTKEITEGIQDEVLGFIYNELNKTPKIRSGDLVSRIIKKYKKSGPTIFGLLKEYLKKQLLVRQKGKSGSRERVTYYTKPY